MEEEFAIDNYRLISLVKQNPVLWDKSLELYKNRQATHIAWKDIVSELKPNLKVKPDKTHYGFWVKQVVQRWTHIRDNYTRSFKKIQAQKLAGKKKLSKKYVYSKQLRFLQKMFETETESNLEDVQSATESEEEEEEDSSISDEPIDHITLNEPNVPMNEQKKRKLNKMDPNRIEPKFVKVETLDNPRADVNRHISFFNGIIPILDNFDEDQVIEFQMGVLQLVKSVKSSRNNLDTVNVKKEVVQSQSSSDQTQYTFI